MAGLPSLMNQSGQTPGQAPLPGQDPMQQGMASQQGAQTPGGVTGGLSKLPPEQLLAMYNNPQDTTPKLAVAGAYAQAVEQQRLMQMAAGQTAMAQNAQQQQELPVVQQLMSQAQPQETQETQDTQEPSPVMAAYGGMMRGYAGGGAVAFTKGGDVEVRRILQKSPYERTPEENEILRAAGIDVVRRSAPEGGISAINRALESPFLRRMFTGDSYKLSPEDLAKRSDTGATTEQLFRALGGKQFVDPATAQAAQPAAQPVDTSKLFPFGVPESPMMDVPDIQIAQAAPSLRGGPSGAPSRQPAAAPAPAASSALMPTPGLSPEMDAYFRNRMSDLSTRQGLPEEILAGRAGLEALARENIAAQRGEAETFGREARERRDAALARPQMDARALFDIAGSIDTRKGQAVGSLSRGISNLLGQREAAAEAARKEYATAQQTERMLQANVRQSSMLEAQRAQALREGDFNRANQIKDQIDALITQRETLLMERRDKAIAQQIEREKLDVERAKVRAAQEGTSAARSSAEQTRLLAQLSRAEAGKQDLIRKITDDHKEANKQVYLMANIPGTKVTPEMIAQKQDLDRQLAMKIRAATSDLDKIIAQTASQIPGMGALYGTSGGGLPEGVTVEKVK